MLETKGRDCTLYAAIFLFAAIILDSTQTQQNQQFFICNGNPFEIFAMSWKSKALDILKESLYPIPRELNDLDWKSDISANGKRLAEHVCAFCNHPGGGLFAYGINNDATFATLNREKIEDITTKLANVASNNLSVKVTIEHDVQEYEGHSILFVYVPEHHERPVFIRGKEHSIAFHRVAGRTEQMTDAQIRAMMANSMGMPFEKRLAKEGLTANEILQLLHYQRFFELQQKVCPTESAVILSRLSDFGVCKQQGERWSITNLGALLFARDLNQFEFLSNRAVIVRHYKGKNNRELIDETRGQLGYAAGFSGLINYISERVSEETIDIHRERIHQYPIVAIREFVANALVHQNFDIQGIPLSIEIFANKLVITNPGASLNEVHRLIDLPPQSRNEYLAGKLLLLNICERRGSGIDRAIAAIEEMNLPAPSICSEDVYTRVTLYPYKNVKEMSKDEKNMACYQHACLMNEDGERLNNKAVRERFRLTKNQTDVASRIIADAVESGWLKVYDDGSASKKYATYVPFYA